VTLQGLPNAHREALFVDMDLIEQRVGRNVGRPSSGTSLISDFKAG